MNGFDLLAPVYDQLSKLFFGNSIYKATIHHFNHIKPGDKILIVGGGTGKILQAIELQGVEVTYLEKSGAMIEKARQRPVPYKIDFIKGSIDQLPPIQFDVVVTAFFLDMFDSSEGKLIVEKLNSRLKKERVWLFADFVNTKNLWQKILLALMYFFFRLICGIKARSLPDYSALFPTQSFSLLASHKFYKGMIHSVVYKSNS